jgi:hypothetical protein
MATTTERVNVLNQLADLLIENPSLLDDLRHLRNLNERVDNLDSGDELMRALEQPTETSVAKPAATRGQRVRKGLRSTIDRLNH